MQKPNVGQSQPVNNQQTSSSGRDIVSPEGPRIHDNHHLALQSAGSGLLGQQTVDGGQRSNSTLILRPKLHKTWAAMLILGGLSSIVVPGVVLGLLMKQVLMGIALSGVIATVIGIFTGVYFQMEKGDDQRE